MTDDAAATNGSTPADDPPPDESSHAPASPPPDRLPDAAAGVTSVVIDAGTAPLTAVPLTAVPLTAVPIETNGDSQAAPQPLSMPAGMVARRPSRDRVIDCAALDPVAADDWRPRTLAVGALAAAGAGLALALLALRQSLPNATVALSEAEIGGALVLMAALLFVVGIGAFGEGYLAGLWAVAPFSFGVAGSVTVAAYLLAADGLPGIPADPLPTVFVGVAASAVATTGGGFLGRALAWRDRAQPSTFGALKDRYAELCSRYSRLELAEQVPAYRADQYETMLAEAYPRLVAARRELCSSEAGRPALRWMLASGYASVARTLHRVEESVLAAESDPALVGDALHDSLRLTGSTMADRDTLHDHLVAAVRVVSATSTQAFFAPLTPANGTTPAATGKASSGGPSEVEAREVLREVRLAINQFREDRVDGLIRARQHLIWTALAAGATTYLLLALALLRDVSKPQLTAAAAFYLVAALVGLFNRLRLEAGRSAAVEDYGLYLARLVTAPLVSGLAGVAGAFLVAKAPALLSTLTTATAAPTLSAQDIFDLTKNEFGIIIAAAFGLAPAQLAAALQHQADRFEQDLEKSQPAGGSSLAGAATPH